MTEPKLVSPKVFISYAWGDEEYQQWVEQLGRRLADEGIEVILDQWSLKPGQDAFAFMERMVTDLDVRKVLCLCEPQYCAKANANKGGAGAEKTIFSSEVYGKVDQEKFIPVITGLANDGSVPLPVPLINLIYFDFSDPTRMEINFAHLVRNIWGRPLTKPPMIGPPPAFMFENSLSTVAPYARELRVFTDAAEKGNNPKQARGHAKAFVKKWTASLDSLVIRERPEGDVIEEMLRRLDAFQVVRADFVRFLMRGIDYVENFDVASDVSFVLQAGLNLQQRASGYTFDEGLKYALRDLVVVTTALLVEHPSELNGFMKTQYTRESHDDETSLAVFDCHLDGLTAHNHRNADKEGRGRWLSVVGHEAQKRADPELVDFSVLIEADFLLALRFPQGWYPRYVPYASRRFGAFPFFRKAAQDISSLKTVLNVESVTTLFERVDGLGSQLRDWRFHGDIDVNRLTNRERLVATSA